MTQPSIHFDDGGLEVRDALDGRRVLWADVNEIAVFKRDHITVDDICLAVRTEDEWLEVNEEMLGWHELVDRIPDYLPSALPSSEWLPRVMKPAFAENREVIFSRA